MPKLIRLLFPATLIAALCSPAFAQSDPGSLDDLLGLDFPPLEQQETQTPSKLNSPLIMGPEIQAGGEALPATDLVPVPPPPVSVLETPRVDVNEPAPGRLVLPDLTMPTPENTAVDSFDNRLSLKPQVTVQPSEPIELLPFDNGDTAELQTDPRLIRPQPQMQSPQALNYGSRAYSSRSRIQMVPIQVEFFSVSRGIGYQPYGGYRSGYGSYGRPPVGYRPYGGYVPYGGYGRGNGGGRYCPSGR